ncbi:MAG: hypothetical protein CL681_06395 [Blastopirellula sp.]|nr:hypothetical protein [Blastopirellula sp.]
MSHPNVDLPPRFDLRIAALLGHASRLVYENPLERGTDIASQLGMSEISFFDLDETQAFVAANDDLVVVAFRGTEPTTLADWITDLSLDLMRGPLGGEVHSGFYDSLSNIWCDFDDEVRRLQSRKSRPVYVTGHSLGGAMANLAVARWVEMRRPVHALYTFGQPRAGDKVFSLNFDFVFKTATFRFVNRCDIVTRVPPRALGYRHTGTLKYFNDAGELVEGITWWRQFMQRWHGGIERIFDWCGHGFGDHSMVKYCEFLDRAVAQERPTLALRMRSVGEAPTPQAGFHDLMTPRRRAA